MQYVITAYDYTDPEALNRRLANREAHLEGVRRMIREGSFLSGGAILDKAGQMIGSSVHVAFTSRDALDAWLRQDPYTVGQVWESIEIRPVKLVPISELQ